MKFNKFFAMALISSGLVLSACGSNEELTANSESSTSPSVTSSPMAESAPEIDSSETASSATDAPETADHSAPTQGGQVVETGAYHLELVAIPESGGIHLDLFLQSGDTHEAIEGATVTGQVQLPNGDQETVDFEYDADGQHYATLLPETTSGEYKVVILSDINGEKVNGRFSFTK